MFLIYLLCYLFLGTLISLVKFNYEINKANIGAFIAILALYPLYLFVVVFIYAAKGRIYPNN